MKTWFNRNYKTIIISTFLVPIITVAVVSISHVTKWYGISNPFIWAAYLSIGIEIAALSALAAISANMGKKTYFPFGIVTLIQFIGNIYYSYYYIELGSKSFTSWVELTSPLIELIGVEPTDVIAHKRFLAIFSGGMLPLISLSFLHMLIKFTEEDRIKNEETPLEETKEVIVEELSKRKKPNRKNTKPKPRSKVKTKKSQINNEVEVLEIISNEEETTEILESDTEEKIVESDITEDNDIVEEIIETEKEVESENMEIETFDDTNTTVESEEKKKNNI
jgi:hypothetical protein